ncbi:TVP38/TMEM64 family protein [Falsiroseomonas oryziterrae]|uniref:TVP38/TMEM64 family protein n=1 Tax=Falsiroseomonas oryziterrae TaxID=2911368 RepID=UPI001F48B862|nr:TVP38/TMEM64 family protein [Roseomonas sp. NPKOSM-4]
MNWLKSRQARLVLLVLAVLVALQFTPLGQWLSVDGLARSREALVGVVERHGPLAAIGYVALYVFVISLALPGATILTLAGGMLFGAALGTALTVAAATVGATLVFLLARRLFGADALERLGGAAERIAAGIRREAVSYLLFLRLVPLFPFFLVNIVPAFCGVRPKVFVLTTLFGIVPGTLVYSLAGAGLGAALAAGSSFDVSQVLTPQMLGALLGLGALALLAIPLRRRFARD